MRNFFGGLSLPMLNMVVITNVPESDEVINHVASKKVARALIARFSQLTSVIWPIVPYSAAGRFQSRTSCATPAVPTPPDAFNSM